MKGMLKNFTQLFILQVLINRDIVSLLRLKKNGLNDKFADCSSCSCSFYYPCLTGRMVDMLIAGTDVYC